MDKEKFRKLASSRNPDWSRENIERFWDPGRKLIRAVRRWQAVHNSRKITKKIMLLYWKINHRWWSTITQCEIHLNCEIGGGLLLPHPTGIIIHPDAKVGANCLIFQQVTIAGPVLIGGHVDIGAGAKVLGPISIGNHVQIAANAVVTRDLPSNCVAVGIPAAIK